MPAGSRLLSGVADLGPVAEMVDLVERHVVHRHLAAVGVRSPKHERQRVALTRSGLAAQLIDIAFRNSDTPCSVRPFC